MPSSRRIRRSRRPPYSMSCVRRSTAGSRSVATCTSIHGRQPVRGVAAGGSHAVAAWRRVREPALRQSDILGRHRARRAATPLGAALLQRARARVRVHLHPNATGALRLVREAYPFGSGDRFLATFDNHNSVNGIRQLPGRGVLGPRMYPSTPGICGYRTAASNATSTTRRPPATTCSRTQRNRTSPGSSTRSRADAQARDLRDNRCLLAAGAATRAQEAKSLGQ